MANYKRVISYMYLYRNQLKGNNVGFARIETRGNECKITLHIRVSNMKDQEIRGYIYCWYGKELHGIYIGDIHISNGVGELVVKTDVDNIMNTKYRFSEMGGILLFSSEAQYIATEWDGKAVLFDTIKVDSIKPSNYLELKEENEKKSTSEAEGVLAAAENEQEKVKIEEVRQEDPKVETAVAMLVPPEEKDKEPAAEQKLAEEEKPAENLSKLENSGENQNEMIEDRVADEKPVATGKVEKESVEEPSLYKSEQEKERPGTFPLSQEKMEHLDQQAQELFGTMLMDTLFPPEQEENKEGQAEPESEEPHILTINPKTAIECFAAFRGCESEQEFNEIEEEIHTMQQEIKHLELLQKSWRIKQARIKEMKMAEEEERLREEKEKKMLQEKIREEYKIDGIQSELEAAQVKRALTERIFNKFPKIEPFEDVAVEQCVRIEPQDLGIFPMENWILANNSFLLHGYYSYRHLIFVMEEKDGVEHYLLGVPGVNYSRERFMANMFGFNDFKTLRSEDNESGEFGYWCHEIIM